ncbi:hypothetical protein M407DRAFT_241870 [Tulasnella calospora MUT 4182]|uniref:Uncharacterized protein n=1 Tax=Tulasnella calospora MUT 4182 TaxID=1051891 RepID=A0A0C3MBJ5_9AGAM|nr:hypothetical protein M407DRAFT_241870 [Tulasnella calospora MUT 4182]
MEELNQSGRSNGYVWNVWNVLPDGSLQGSLPVFDTSSQDTYGNYTRKDVKTSEVLLATSGVSSIPFVKPGTLPWQDDPKCKAPVTQYQFTARIVFEPI